MSQLKNILIDVRVLTDSAREDSERRNYTTYPHHIDEFNRLLGAVERAGLQTDLEPIRPVPSNQLAAFGSVGMGTNAEIAKLREIVNKSTRLLARIAAYQESPQIEPGEPTSAMQRLLAPLKKPVAFMSYAHRDDKDGRLTKLRERLADEVSVQIGEDFKIFQDRQDILWGQNWKQRIDESLDEVTFLIAIITPSFFNSQHCREELQRFLNREKELGRNDLVLPIYYVDSSLMNDAARRKSDKLAQAVHAHQYADWRQLRGISWSSSRIRRKLELLATQVYEALERVQESRTPGTSVEAPPFETAKDEDVEDTGRQEKARQKWLGELITPADVDRIQPLFALAGHEGVAHSVAFSPDGRLLASDASDALVRLWRVEDRSLLRTLQDHKKSRWIDSVAFSPDGRLLASAASDALVRLWRVEDGILSRTLTGHDDAVTDLAFSPDGRLLASASYDKTVRLWRVDDGSLLYTLEHERGIGSVAFSPDGRLLALGGGNFSAEADNTVLLWRVRDRVALYTLEGHKGGVSGLAFSPGDGQVLASCGGDRMVRLWRAEDGTLLHSLVGHEQNVSGVDFSPDGQLLASASYDKTVRLWRTQDGRFLRTLKEHKDQVYSVAFSPAGQLFASCGADHMVQLWGKRR